VDGLVNPGYDGSEAPDRRLSARGRQRSKRRRDGLRRRRDLTCPTPREDGADHELHLVEEHGRQEDHAEVRAGEEHARHWHAGREAFLRSAEDNGDRVLPGARPIADAASGAPLGQPLAPLEGKG
jgi:hypothetical protein